ncbi:hypothetical protein BURPS305_3515 [Burkholderia pseudomallei 305]|nr:hypothetical protein BPC006_II0247 [Burkholderia pseudomallei BPC006]EBA47732.1 hypothetical protein BURPS305_3515 [Burkholderia pseudomallei 305]EEH29252.1 conserved hypothetical protein [Burkholderia pseudomallei Pakistan 9]
MTRSVRHRTRFAAHAGPCVRATLEAPGPFGNLFFIAGLAARIPFCTRSPRRAVRRYAQRAQAAGTDSRSLFVPIFNPSN